jgi:hypothetical protein
LIEAADGEAATCDGVDVPQIGSVLDGLGDEPPVGGVEGDAVWLSGGVGCRPRRDRNGGGGADGGRHGVEGVAQNRAAVA